MTSFLRNNALDLATAAVVAPLTSYGFPRVFPGPNVGFLATVSTMNICAGLVINDLGREYAKKLTIKYGYVANNEITNYIFHRLKSILTITSANILLPIFSRYVGQRMGIQVPDYLHMLSCFYLAGSAFWIAKPTLEILRD